MVYGHLSVYNLITAIPVDIHHTEIMVTLTTVFLMAGGIGIEHPFHTEPLAVPGISGKHGTGVIATAHHRMRMNAIEIGHGGKETVAAVGIPVAPCADIATRRQVIHRIHRPACLAVEYGEILVPAHHAALERAVVGTAVTNDPPFAVLASIGGLADDFGLAVAVEVIDEELRVMRAGADVVAEVDTPLACTVKLITVEIGGARKPVMGVVMRVRGVPFEDDFVFAVTVDIAYRSIVGRIEIFLAEGVASQRGTVDRNVYISQRCVGRKGIRGFCLAFHRLYSVLGSAFTGIVVGEECGFAYRLRIDSLAVAIDIKALCFRV